VDSTEERGDLKRIFFRDPVVIEFLTSDDTNLSMQRMASTLQIRYAAYMPEKSLHFGTIALNAERFASFLNIIEVD
jgi:hypothetical protein